MKRMRKCVAALLSGFAVTAVAAVLPADDRPGFETYVVRSGDTLSKVSARVFGDARRWREILAANPQVTNANRIYPGDSLLVPAAGSAARGGSDAGLAAGVGAGGGSGAAAGTGAGAGAGAGAGTSAETGPGTGSGTGAGGDHGASATGSGGGLPGGAAQQGSDDGAAASDAAAMAGLPVEPAPSVAVVNPRLYRSAGYLAENLPSVAIVATQDERILLGSGDAAIVNAAISPGSRFNVVRADRRIFHPLTGRCLGWLVRVLGTAEVTCRGERTSTVALSGLRDAAGVGDYLVPLDPNDQLEENVLPGRMKPGCLGAGAADAVIVAFDEDRPAVAEHDFAYIDRGASSCVGPGKRFTIYREIPGGSRIEIGELLVLRAGEASATALITTSVQEVEVGSLLRAR